MIERGFARGIGTGVLLISSLGAIAQTYPAKPIRIIVGSPAGGEDQIRAVSAGDVSPSRC